MKILLLLICLILSSLISISKSSAQETPPATPIVIVTESPSESPSPTDTPLIPSLEKSGVELLKDRPWLQELYSWNESFDLSHQQIQANQTGAYCIGNGRAFALVGLSNPLWSWSNLYGDSYQEPDLGALHMSVTRAGLEIPMPKQQIGWVKRSGIVKVSAEGQFLEVETYDFAPAQISDENSWDNPSVLIRLVRIVNKGDQPENDLDIELKIQPAWNVQLKEVVEGNDLIIDQKAARAKKRTVWRLGAFNSRNVRIWDNNLHYSVPTLQPSSETWVAFFLSSADSSHDNREQISSLRKLGPVSLLDQTRNYYTHWFQSGTEFSGDSKTVDLFEIESMIFKCQQSHTGGFSPLIGYSYTWIRDNNGPIRWFLKTGHPQEARRAMDFFYGVGSTMGSLPNSIRVDYPLNYRLKDLSNIHVEHAETPNWIVLQHWWYYLTTGDIELIRARWTYLDRCIMGQVNEEDKYFFHRDETYLWCLESRCFDYTSFPNYDLSTYAFSADSSFDIVSAAEHLAYLGKYLEMDHDVAELKKLAERVRAKAEETYWNDKAGYWEPAQSLLGPLYNAPFANILLNPFWCGYARNDLDPLGETPETSKKAVEAIQNAYPALGKEDSFWKTTPTMEYFVGMNPGQMLYAFCQARLPWAEKAYEAVLKTSTPSGEFAEMYDGDYHPWNPPAWGVGTSGRVRPWEGGLNTESILQYLTGFSPDAGDNRVVFAPHMPEDQKHFEANRFLVGNAQISLMMNRSDNHTWTFTLRLEKGQPLDVVVDFWPNHRLFANVSTESSVSWDKNLLETNQHQARCHFTAEIGNEYSFLVVEDSNLSDVELNPPKSVSFEPDPYLVPNAEILLLTSPSGIFNVHKHTRPENFLTVARSELLLSQKIAHSVSFLDMDLPINQEDIIHGLLDDKGLPKVKMALFGRGAFCPGKHDFKPDSYWSFPGLGQAIKKFLEEGGCVFLGPSYPDREILPPWLITLTGGGWEEGIIPDKAIATISPKNSSNQTLLDEVEVNQASSESSHSVTFAGETFEESQTLPDALDETKTIHENGRGFKGFYQFKLNTKPGFKHHLWVRTDTGHNLKGMALMVQDHDRWVQLGIRTQNDGLTRHFEVLYFDVPQKWITSNQTVFRLISKYGDEVNAYHLWIYQVEKGKDKSLNELLNLTPAQVVGDVSHGLVPKGDHWKSPLVLAQHPEQSALLIQKVGKGYILRSELSLEDSIPILKSLLNSENMDNLQIVLP